MNKKVWFAAMILGLLLVGISIGVPLIAAGVSEGATGPDTAIIGGADAPTFGLVFGWMFRKLFCLLPIGVVLSVISALQLHKKQYKRSSRIWLLRFCAISSNFRLSLPYGFSVNSMKIFNSPFVRIRQENRPGYPGRSLFSLGRGD